ncbi:MAG: sigma-70 family RNA polymerase sigma factor [Chloroflexi bacterium]|nr:sigma-70 family RNA polymerase sigma factor [Chloroflexota bacterium]MCL5109311.1 sigma-70 family RNA polymerase sigma factor [Chloroflexota bacterium]
MVAQAVVYEQIEGEEREPALRVVPSSVGELSVREDEQEIPELTEAELALADSLSGEVRGEGGDATDDPIWVYLREVRPVPLLTAKEEALLGKAIARGFQAEARLARAMPGTEERGLLLAESERGRWARQRLLEANQRLVIGLAKRNLGRGLAFADLIQEGNLGLMRAIEKFDYRRGFRFSTYATWWVRQSMSRAIADHGRSVRVPVHMLEQTTRVVRTTAQLQQQLGREPKTTEIASRLQITPAKVLESLRVAQDAVSLETPVGEEDDAYLSDFIADENAPEPYEMAELSALRDQIGEVLGGLAERERRVLELRFGLADGNARTLEETGTAVGVTRERARQIESEALAKLRTPRNRDKLREYLN